jgi:uncharacterized NAD(P)/FAD-binding protein YdhS
VDLGQILSAVHSLVDVFMGAPAPNVPDCIETNAVFPREHGYRALQIGSTLEDVENVLRCEAVMSGPAMPLYVEQIARLGCVLKIDDAIVAWNSI